MSKTYRRSKRYFDDDSNWERDETQTAYRKEKHQERRKSRAQQRDYEEYDNEESIHNRQRN